MEKQTMKSKLTKIGVSALCGSLAAVASAQAGSMSVSGSAQATWMKGSQTTNGNPIGMNSGLTFKGTGELDNGTAVSYTLTHADQAAYSAGSIALATPSLGTITIGHATGGLGIGGYDDKMPTAWEETWGNGVGTSVNLQKGVGSSSALQWASPSMMGMTLKIAYAPRNAGGAANDKATISTDSRFGRGVDVVLDMAPIEGMNLWVGGSDTADQGTQYATDGLQNRNDHQEATAGFTYAIGPATIGFAKAYEVTGNQAVAEVDYYVNTMYGISFNVSDNLSVSANRFDAEKHVHQGFSPEMRIDSLQAAYTMGGATLKYARTEVENAGYSLGASKQKDANVFALSLAF